MNRFKTGLALLALPALLTAAPAEAAILPGADFKPGTTLGAGISGLSADYALGGVSLGAGLGMPQQPAPGTHFYGRALVRFYDTPSGQAAFVVGTLFNPGEPGGRRFLVPDVGLSMARRFKLKDIAIIPLPPIDVPLVLRATVTLTTADQSTYIPPPTEPRPTGNFFQRLALGPNTTFGVGFQFSDNVEVTLGSGTVLGLRVNF